MAREDTLSWISDHVLPHEPLARHWLRRFRADGMEADDVVQEAYARLATLSTAAHVQSGKAYFMMTVRNLALEHLRRQKLVRIEALAEIRDMNIADDRPSIEDEISGREQLTLVKKLIDGLPDRCRAILRLRKIEGLSQREAADRLGVTENVVEKQTAIGLKAVLKQLADRGLEDVLPSKGLASRDKKRRGGNR
jgi:RNA polymerase sigma-70 factor (ECF subfamily)